jgi:hypothetical protein
LAQVPTEALAQAKLAVVVDPAEAQVLADLVTTAGQAALMAVVAVVKVAGQQVTALLVQYVSSGPETSVNFHLQEQVMNNETLYPD